ncbi:MAG: hypothetical protein WDO73_03040 [Ignavibacteriota bacterium]
MAIEIERQAERVKERRLKAAKPGEDPLAIAGLLEHRMAGSSAVRPLDSVCQGHSEASESVTPMARNEDEYFAQINKLLERALPSAPIALRSRRSSDRSAESFHRLTSCVNSSSAERSRRACRYWRGSGRSSGATYDTEQDIYIGALAHAIRLGKRPRPGMVMGGKVGLDNPRHRNGRDHEG